MRKLTNGNFNEVNGGWRFGFKPGEYRLTPEERDHLLKKGYVVIPHNINVLHYYAENKYPYGVCFARTGKYISDCELRSILGPSENEQEAKNGASERSVLCSSLELCEQGLPTPVWQWKN